MYSKSPLLLVHCVLAVLPSMLASGNLRFRADFSIFAFIFVHRETWNLYIVLGILYIVLKHFIYSSGDFIYSSGLNYVFVFFFGVRGVASR